MGQINPTRERVIIEMKDQERGYISNESLGRDFKNKKTQQAIYYLFHMDPFSTKKYKKEEDDENYSKKAAKFNIEILCTIEKGKRQYQVFDTPTPINRVDISDFSKRMVSILKVGKETIKSYDSNEELPDELYDTLYDYIASLLEPDDERAYDNRYTMAYKNFAFCLDNIRIKTWVQIEYVLRKIAQEANNNEDKLLQLLSDKTQCEEYIQALLSDPIVEIYVEKQTIEMIDEIALLYYKLFTRYAQDWDKEEKKNVQDSQEYKFIKPILTSIQNESKKYPDADVVVPSIAKLFSELFDLEKRFFGSLSTKELESLISLAVIYQQYEFLAQLRNKKLIAPDKED